MLANDVTAPIAIKTVREITDRVFDAERVILVPDHYVPNKDITRPWAWSQWRCR